MTYNLQPSYATVSELTTNDKAISVMYGRMADGTIVPIRVDSSGAVAVATNAVRAFNSNPSPAGSSTEVLVVTGLLATDTILAITQVTPGVNSSAYTVGYSGQAKNALTVQWSANAGGSAVIRVMVSR